MHSRIRLAMMGLTRNFGIKQVGKDQIFTAKKDNIWHRTVLSYLGSQAGVELISHAFHLCDHYMWTEFQTFSISIGNFKKGSFVKTHDIDDRREKISVEVELKVDNKNRKPKLHLISFMSRWLLNNISLLIDFRVDVQKIVAIFKNKRFIVYVITNEAPKKTLFAKDEDM